MNLRWLFRLALALAVAMSFASLRATQGQSGATKRVAPKSRRGNAGAQGAGVAAFGELKGHTGTVWAVAFSPDGRLLASASGDKSVRLWDVATGAERFTLTGHKEGPVAVSFSPDGSLLASGDHDGSIRFWETNSGRSARVIENAGDIWALTFLPDGKTLAAGGGQKIRFWDVSTGKEQEREAPPERAALIRSLTVSADGTKLAWTACDTDPPGEVALWDIRAGGEPKVLPGVTKWFPWSVALSPDGKFVYAGGMNDSGQRAFGDGVVWGGTRMVWEGRTGRVLAAESARPGPSLPIFYGVAASPDGRLVALATNAANNRVELWNASPFEPVGELLGHTNTVHSVAFSPAGGVLASGGEDNSVRLWEVPTGPGRRAASVAGQARPAASAGAVASKGFGVLAARYGADERWIDVTGEVQASVKDGRMALRIETLPDPAFGTHKALAVAYAVDGKIGVAIARDDRQMSLPAESGSPKTVAISGSGFEVLAAQYGSDDRWADVTGIVSKRVADGRLQFAIHDAGFPDPAAGTRKSLAIVYALRGRVGLAVSVDGRGVDLPPDAGPSNSGANEIRKIELTHGVSSVAFGPGGRQVVAGVEDGSIRVLDAATGAEVQRLEGKPEGKVVLALSSRGDLVLSGGADRVLRLREFATGRERATFSGHTEEVMRVVLSPDGRSVASSAWDKTVRLWDAKTGRELHKITGHGDIAIGLAFTPDGRRLVTSSWDQTLRVWNVASGSEERKIEVRGGKLGDLALFRAGRFAIAGLEDKSLASWDLTTGAEQTRYSACSDGGWGIVISPDGSRFLHTDGLGLVLRDLRTGREITRLERHLGQIRSVALSPDGRRAVSGAADKTVRIWMLPGKSR